MKSYPPKTAPTKNILLHNLVVQWGVARNRFSAKNRAKLNSMSTRTNHACEGKEEGGVGGGTVSKGEGGQGEGAPA